MKTRILILLLIASFIQSCQKDQISDAVPNPLAKNKVSNFDSEIVTVWMETYLKIEKDLSGFRPTATSRAIGYINMAAYETALPGMEAYISNQLIQTGLTIPALKHDIKDINWNVALNTCYNKMFRHFFQNMKPEHFVLLSKIDQDMSSQLRNKMFGDVYENSIEWGITVADAMISFANSDSEGVQQTKNPFPNSYVPPSHPGNWQPTAPDFTPALFPYWGKVRVFAAKPEDFVATEPIPFSTSPTSEYYKQHKALNDQSLNLTDQDKWKAEFWSDDIVGLTFSPPARLISISNQMLTKEKLNLEDALYFYCKLGIAINDAAVAAWYSKYIYNVERPESYIKKYINPQFESYLGTAIGRPGLEPPFPGYPSGHSTFAGINASIFKEFFGTNYNFTDNSHKDRIDFLGKPRTYRTWDEMAEENAYSRISLGVHVKMDCDEGLRLGYLIGKRVLKYNLKK